MRRFLASVALAAMLAAGAAAPSAPAAASAPALPQAASCSGVWVVVDFGSLGGITTRCATSHGTGAAALRSAGFSPTITEGFVYKISGKPSKPDINKAYWSYWHATRNADGSYNGWTYSNLGANSYQPTAGNAEGWRFQSLSEGKVRPGAAPPSGTETAKPSKSAKPKPTPSATPTPSKKPSSKPTASRTPSASAKAGTPSASGKPSTKASATTGATTTSPASSATPTSSSAPATPGGADPSSPVAVPVSAEAPSAVPADEAGSGSPVGLITTLGIVVAGVAGLGGWWWKGRNS
ncbi:MAG: hypothetical protein QM695_04130 [Micropruina sp.]